MLVFNLLLQSVCPHGRTQPLHRYHQSYGEKSYGEERMKLQLQTPNSNTAGIRNMELKYFSSQSATVSSNHK
jgi:hypothetical protein